MGSLKNPQYDSLGCGSDVEHGFSMTDTRDILTPVRMSTEIMLFDK